MVGIVLFSALAVVRAAFNEVELRAAPRPCIAQEAQLARAIERFYNRSPDARSFLRMVDAKIHSSEIPVEHREALIRPSHRGV
jgi:hypothetical protein